MPLAPLASHAGLTLPEIPPQVPVVSSWVQAKASVSAAAGGTAVLQSAGLQAAVTASVTLGVIVMAGALFSALYWWWTVFNPARWIKKYFKALAPKSRFSRMRTDTGSDMLRLRSYR